MAPAETSPSEQYCETFGVTYYQDTSSAQCWRRPAGHGEASRVKQYNSEVWLNRGGDRTSR